MIKVRGTPTEIVQSIHGVNPVCMEYSLCGLAYDAYESHDVSEQVTLAQPGQRVTCKACISVIDNCRKFKWYVQP